MSDHLSLPVRLPNTHQHAHRRLDTLVQHVATRVLHNYHTPEHLDGIGNADHHAWKYFDEREPFDELADHELYEALHDETPSKDFELYLPSRIRRCILQKIGETLRSHADRRESFQSIKHVLPDHKIRRIHRRRIKKTLWDDGEYLSSGYLDILLDQLNGYYDRHGRYPDSYFDLQDPPEYSDGTLPYSADDGPTSGQAITYEYDEDEGVSVEVKTPDTVTPEGRGDWSWHEHDPPPRAMPSTNSTNTARSPPLSSTPRSGRTATHSTSFHSRSKSTVVTQTTKWSAYWPSTPECERK